ncbi:hypothetical protein [Bradyrhizobium sp. BRP56]|uniref:hypothetical protein n=1 Tax=Bradyrhizobium sp. BRP56 TaxID=2793819 RepID=UPI001CD45E83|nr:hypothetical protein [Bradyrhizobium sp. BRP56]MCA1400063.1 hypothetical protein [Bradyrhizobium sp. BRP56]
MIDLADYTKPMRDQLRKGEFAAVYVVTSPAGITSVDLRRVGFDLSRVGYGLDLVATIGRLQASSPAPLTIHAALWVPNRAIATNIARAVQCDMMPVKRAGGWYEAPGATMERAVELAAFRIHPGATMLWHGELLRRWREMAA